MEQALKERDKILTSDSCNDNESDILDSPKASSPLLTAAAAAETTTTTTSSTIKQKPSNFKFSRQKRVSSVYSFEPGDDSLNDKDFISD